MEAIQPPIEIIWMDRVLNYLAAPSEEPASRDELVYTKYTEDNVVYQHLSLIYPEMKGQSFQKMLSGILHKMEKDGYVAGKDFHFEGQIKRSYAITVEGKLFTLNKGYQGHLDQMNAAVARQATEDQRNKYLLLITFAIGVWTMVAGVYYLLYIFDFYEAHYLKYEKLAYFLTGLVSGLLLLSTIWLPIKVLRKPKQKT